jgi:iron(II)-dependent oxidoreductase
MEATTTAVRRLNDDIQARLIDARKRTDDMFGIVREEAIYDRPVPERHRIIFYLGHLEAFDWNLLAERALELQPFHATFDKLFAFGIDPVGGGLPTDVPADWPQRAEIESYRMRVRETLDRAINYALARPWDANPDLATLLKVAIEHRLMHAETLAYLLHRLPSAKKIGTTEKLSSGSPKESPFLVTIPAGTATLGTLSFSNSCRPAVMKIARSGTMAIGNGSNRKMCSTRPSGSRKATSGCVALCLARSPCLRIGPCM